MAQHEVNFTVPFRTLGKSDVRFKVFKNTETFGELRISKGSLVWFPKDHTKGRKVSWTKFDKFMRQNTTEERR